ncbi:MAG: anaerobic ribonucleoside-triphosphate reductase activating protein [Lachnospiraceae bacterium]|nr:anaerobic ribonucleoside-triphosphate reductase activating protein [Lachnospiraceae bacterium]
MRYGKIKYFDIADGVGVRTALFVSGCTHRCPGCFNPETWDFNYGEEFTGETAEEIIEKSAPPYIAGLTLLGGEPMEPENQRSLLPFVRTFRERLPGKSVWCYTGYIYEKDLKKEEGRAHCEVTDELLSLIDILVDGEFDESLKNLSLHFRGSENQHVIDLKTGEYLYMDDPGKTLNGS